MDTFSANEALGLPADARDYRVAAAMLAALGVSRIHLLTANPDKVRSLSESGIALASVTPLELPATDWSRRYLSDKRDRFSSR